MSKPTELDPQMRGDDFIYHFTLGNSWTRTMFTGGMKFTLRDRIPKSSVVTDSDVVDQASIAGTEITFANDTDGTIYIAASRTKRWPDKVLHWDLQGMVTTGTRVYTIDWGTVLVIGDITRTTTP